MMKPRRQRGAIQQLFDRVTVEWFIHELFDVSPRFDIDPRVNAKTLTSAFRARR
jgi:hypothetical protein